MKIIIPNCKVDMMGWKVSMSGANVTKLDIENSLKLNFRIKTFDDLIYIFEEKL